MPAAVASGVQLGGPPKNKKIVFDDSGKAVAKANKKDHPKNASPKDQAKKPTKIKFGEDGEAVSKKPFNKSHQNGQNKSGPQRTKFGDDGEAISQKPFNKNQQNGQKPQIKFGDDGEAIAQKPFNKSHQKFNGQKPGFEKKPQKIKFNDDGAPPQKQFNKNQQQNDQPFNKNGAKPEQAKKSQKIKFGDADDAIEKSKKPQRIKFDEDGAGKNVSDSEGDSDVELGAVLKKHNKYHSKADEDEASQKKWYNVYPDYPSTDEVLDMKDNEQLELFNLCKSSFESEKNTFNKRNPTDARWLQTALHKGTAKDRANAGALLVTSNPLGNLEALTTLIGFCKLSNKASNDVIAVLTDLWQEVLLPPNRKLLSIHTRGADWKKLKKDDKLHKEQQRRIYAYWYFESELKDQYHEFLKNVMQGLQTGQEHNKNSSIVAAARLLCFAPEKEQMLLTMLINKLGDPVPKVASKALHHLSDVAQRHPNMCGVIVAEAEKLLFRNNISERAQHFALCFLSSIAPSGRPEVCTKLVNICFALFKVLVQKGAVNNRTMQAILRCLQKAIVEAQPAKDSNGELLNKEMQDTIYRLVHLADIRVSIQTLGLLLQLVTVKTEKSDRFYNALYVKLLDLDLVNVGSKTAAHLLHIVHRAIHIDNHVARAQAFIKRLLQITLYAPPHIAAGCLIVLHKLLRMRRELVGGSGASEEVAAGATVILPADVDLDKFGSDDEEVYKDVKEEKEAEEDKSKPKEDKDEKSQGSSWHHASVAATESKVREIDSCKYDPYHRVPAFAGAGYALRNELLLLRNHYHPTVQVFAEQILQQARIDYYGDPLRDFGLPHFLERFAFKNPKKLDNSQAAESATVAHKRYIAQGGRGKPVKSLTKANCTEDEMFIFNFLEHKRRQAEIVAQSKKEKGVKKEDPDGDEDADGDGEYLKEGEVDDDEFEAYLDGYFGKKFKDGGDAEEEEDELNFLQELGGEMQADKSKKDKKKKKSAEKEEDDMEDIDDDWGDDDLGEEDDDDEMAGPGEDHSDDETGSIDLEPMDDDYDDEGSISDGDTSDMPESPDEDDDDAPPKSKRSRKDSGSMVDGRSFAKTLKQSHDMSSLFAAADDFSSMLEESAKVKGQGTSNAVFNKDKSSAKQLKWEENRRSNTKTYTGKKFSGKSKAGKGGKPQKAGKKRKH